LAFAAPMHHLEAAAGEVLLHFLKITHTLWRGLR
jgi:hypothetical protein